MNNFLTAKWLRKSPFFTFVALQLFFFFFLQFKLQNGFFSSEFKLFIYRIEKFKFILFLSVVCTNQSKCWHFLFHHLFNVQFDCASIDANISPLLVYPLNICHMQHAWLKLVLSRRYEPVRRLPVCLSVLSVCLSCLFVLSVCLEMSKMINFFFKIYFI